MIASFLIIRTVVPAVCSVLCCGRATANNHLSLSSVNGQQQQQHHDTAAWSRYGIWWAKSALPGEPDTCSLPLLNATTQVERSLNETR
uniref:Putative secreted protein n=1 Tax=Anopheles darlingi TaxID=43151 RepID=A0A2M4DMV4_ANODA